MCLESPSNFKGTTQRFSADLLFFLFQGLRGLHGSTDDAAAQGLDFLHGPWCVLEQTTRTQDVNVCVDTSIFFFGVCGSGPALKHGDPEIRSRHDGSYSASNEDQKDQSCHER